MFSNELKFDFFFNFFFCLASNLYSSFYNRYFYYVLYLLVHNEHLKHYNKNVRLKSLFFYFEINFFYISFL